MVAGSCDTDTMELPNISADCLVTCVCLLPSVAVFLCADEILGSLGPRLQRCGRRTQLLCLFQTGGGKFLARLDLFES